MAPLIFNAIGRGYSARSILGAIGRRSPQYANAINDMYFTGYTANSILQTLTNKMSGKNYDEDQFLTAREKTLKNDQKNKTKAYTQAIAAMGLTGAAAVGAYALIQKNRPQRPELIIPSEYGRKTKQPHTITQSRAALPYHQKQLTSKEQKKLSPPIQPKSNTKPIVTAPPMIPYNPQQVTQQQQIQPYNPKSIDVVRKLREEQRFKNILDAGYDSVVSTQILRQVIPKNVLEVMEKSEGGLEQIVKDYSGYLKDSQQQQRQIQEVANQNQPQFSPPEALEQVGQIQLPTTQKPIQPQVQQPKQPEQPPQVQLQQPKQEIAPVEQPQIQKPSAPVKPLVSLKNGKIGTLEGIEKGVATINIDGNLVREKKNQLTIEGPEAETAARELINAIPEGMKSTALMSAVYIPQHEMAVLKYWSGEAAWFSGLPEDDYMQIALGTYTPKGEAKTGIAEYTPSVADSHGAANHDLIVKNPRFSKENKGITWGYAKNEFDLLHGMQKHLTKFSKERYDKEGNLITSKRKKK